MKVTHWFPTVLGEAQMENAEELSKKLIPVINKIKGKDKKKNFYYYQIHKDKKFKKINDFVFKHVSDFSKMHSYGQIKYHDSWFNDYQINSVNSPHSHDGSVFTAVYFLVGHIEDASLIIHSPKPADMMNPRKSTPNDPHKNMNDLNSEHIIIKPNTGYLCIFRSYLWHEVPLKTNNLPRVSIAYTFNVC
jgi:uncharacterized protein (TIGR02466 family)